MSETGRKRPWLAVLLALIYPGLGHVYLREWLRAVLWFGLVISTTTLLVSDEMMPSEPTVDSLLAASEAMPIEVSLSLFAIVVLSMADAYWMASREREPTEVTDGQTCPVCGNELDEDLEFCHWCTTKLDSASPEE